MAKKRDWIIGIIIASSALLLLLFVLASLLSIVGEGDLSLSASGRRIALIEIEGPIISSKPIVRQLKKYANDSSIPALVLRIDSPGGGVAASQEIYGEILKVRRDKGKKVVASMGSVAASGGYYVAVAADTIVANPGTITGSIGVLAELTNAEELLKKIGLDFEVVKSGKYKDMGSPARRMTDEERQLLQGVVDDTYNQFVDAVVSGRGLEREEVLRLADGRVFTGRQALEYNFVDLLGDYEDAIDLAAKMVGMEKGPRTVKERRRKVLDFLDLVLEKLSMIVAMGARSSLSLKYIFP